MSIDLPSLVLAAGGEIVGRVRTQKMVYLLDQMGLKSGFEFEYRHYGPFSEDLADQMEDDVIFRRLTAEPKRRQSDGVPYTVYRAGSRGDGEAIDVNLPGDKIRSSLAEMQRQSATVLELAATIHWLAEVEGYEDWRSELVRRKGAKTEEGRTEKALSLLRRLDLPPVS